MVPGKKTKKKSKTWGKKNTKNYILHPVTCFCDTGAQGCCATFSSIMAKNSSQFLEVFEANHLTCRHIQGLIYLIDMWQLKKFKRLEKTRLTFPKRGRQDATAAERMKRTQKAKGTTHLLIVLLLFAFWRIQAQVSFENAIDISWTRKLFRLGSSSKPVSPRSFSSWAGSKILIGTDLIPDSKF